MVGKTALNKEMKHLNGAYFRTIKYIESGLYRCRIEKAWHTDRTHRQGKQRRHSRPCTGRSQQAYESRVVLLVFTFTFIESLNL